MVSCMKAARHYILTCKQRLFCARLWDYGHGVVDLNLRERRQHHSAMRRCCWRRRPTTTPRCGHAYTVAKNAHIHSDSSAIAI